MGFLGSQILHKCPKRKLSGPISQSRVQFFRFQVGIGAEDFFPSPARSHKTLKEFRRETRAKHMGFPRANQGVDEEVGEIHAALPNNETSTIIVFAA